jgi:hypothetical protein
MGWGFPSWAGPTQPVDQSTTRLARPTKPMGQAKPGRVGADTEMLVLDTEPSAMMIVDCYYNDFSIKIRESLNTAAARPKIKSMVPSMVHRL